MSDYLGNLLARSFAPITAVRPERPSFFEPVKTNVELATPFQAGISSEASVPPLDFETAAAPVASLFPRVKAHVSKRAQPVTGGSVKKYVPIALVEASEKTIRKKETDVDSVANARSRMSVSPADADAGWPKSGTSVTRIEIEGTPRLREANPPHRVVLPVNAPHPNSRPAGTPLARSEGEPQLEVPSDSALFSGVFPIADGVAKPVQPVPPHAEPVRPMAPLVRELSANLAPPRNAPAPTIQVTIGRLEVRVVQPPLPQRSRPVAPKTLSLDEYMHQRASGGRR